MAHEAVGPAGRPPETVDRLMVGVCGAIWLVWLAATVFATVALVRLGSGRAGGGERQSSWLLYSIIVLSALVILIAIPLLLRARRARRGASAESPVSWGPSEEARAVEAPTEKMRVFGVDPYARRQDVARPGPSGIPQAFVDRLWLRGTTSLLSVMGLALTAVSIGTYLLADASETAAWVALGLAGVLTVAMPAVLAFFQRQLGEAVEAGE